MLIARWILNEEDLDENDTYLELDRIACIVQESLRGNSSSTNSTPTAPLEERMALSSEEFATVTHPTACLRILDCLKHVLYQQLQFKGNVNEYYKKDNSMLYQVLILSQGQQCMFIIILNDNMTDIPFIRSEVVRFN